MRGLAAAIAVVAVGITFAGAAPAARRHPADRQRPAARQLPIQRAALAALTRAVKAGSVDRATAARDRAEINRAARLIRHLPGARGSHVAVALNEIASFSGRLSGTRAVALFGQLKANSDYFSKHWAPRDRTDITDADGVLYRYFARRCFEFHPLGAFGKLNQRINAKDVAGTERLAKALIARGVHQYGGVGWEYYFPFGGGNAPWLSGMAQAVATQAFTRAAALLPDDEAAFLHAARGAYRTIPGHLMSNLPAGPWIRLYAFDSTPVLNAQLQTIYSLRIYAAKTGDAAASWLVGKMQDAAVAMLPYFDTGFWTYYSLPHTLSTMHYQDYVVRLLNLLSHSDKRFADTAARFASYRTQPPAFRLQPGGLGQLRFWLSKPSRVYASAGGQGQTAWFGDGWHVLRWSEPTRAGIYPVGLSARDWAGNSASFEALPLVRVGAGAAGAKAIRGFAASASPRPALSIGAGLDFPAQAYRAPRLGLRLVRIAVDWPLGATTPDLALGAAFQALTGVQVLLELDTPTLPADATSRTALGEYAAALAQQIPGISRIVLSPAPTTLTAVGYASALTAVRDAVQAVLPEVAVGPLVDGSESPRAVLMALGLVRAPADFVALRPAPAPSDSVWTEVNVPQLVSAFAQSFGQTAPPVVIDGLARPTTIPAEEVSSYPAAQQPAADAVPASAQGKAYATVIARAACSTNVAAIVLDRLVDDAAAPASPTGLYYASGNPKASAALVGESTGPAQRGTVLCPGLASRAGAGTLEFPAELDPSASPSVLLSCLRDCLYLVTLDDAQGRPASARRGELRGGGKPLTLELPKARLDRDQYRLDVRLVDRVNPGAVTRLASPLLPVSRP